MRQGKVKTLEEIKQLIEKQRDDVRGFGVKEIGVFGSYARNEQEERSDIDILVEFQEGYKTFDGYMELKFYLEDLLQSPVDLVVTSAIQPRLKPYILQEVVYV